MKKIFVNIFLKIYNFFLKLICSIIDSHNYMFFNLFDPIKTFVNMNDIAFKKFHILNKQFIFQLIYFIFCSIYGVFGLEESLSTNTFTYKNFKSSPYVFTHQVYPKLIWNQIDIVVIFFGIPFMILFFIVLVFKEMINSKYWMYINGFTNQTSFFVSKIQSKTTKT